jgi:ribonuclease VapC
MSEDVLDASAVLALLGSEPGHEPVLPHLPGAHMSAVNHAEVLGKLVDGGIPVKSARTYIQRLGIAIDDFGEPADLGG